MTKESKVPFRDVLTPFCNAKMTLRSKSAKGLKTPDFRRSAYFFGAVQTSSIMPIDPLPCHWHQHAMLIYKIFRAPEWDALQNAGQTAGAPVDLADGYVHFSTAEQARETAAKWFADEDGLVLLACETEPMGEDLKWEPSRGGALFPHLYRDLKMTDVSWHAPLPIKNGAHVFPSTML